MPKRIKKLVCGGLVVCFLVSTAGCYNLREPETVTFVTAVGIDKGEKQPFKITFQGITTAKIKSGESGGGEEPIYNVAVEATDFENAVDLASSFLANKLSFSQTKLLIFSRELAKEGLKDQINQFARNIDFRSDAYVGIAQKQAYDFLEAVKPMLTANPSKYYDMMFRHKDDEYIPDSNLNEVYSALTANDKQCVIPLVAKNESELGKKEEKTEKQDEKQGESQAASAEIAETSDKKDAAEQYIAGQVERAAENPSDILGGAVIDRAGRFVGEMTAAETKYYNMIEGGFSSAAFSVSDSAVGDITAVLREAKPPRYQVTLTDGTPQIDVYLHFSLDYVSLTGKSSDADADKVQKEIQSHLSQAMELLLYKTAQNYRCDVWGFYKQIKKNYPDYDALSRIKWEKLYPKATFRVHIDMSQRRSGLVINAAHKEDLNGH